MVADAVSLLVGSRKGLEEYVRTELEIPKVLFNIYNTNIYHASLVCQLPL